MIWHIVTVVLLLFGLVQQARYARVLAKNQVTSHNALLKQIKIQLPKENR